MIIYIMTFDKFGRSSFSANRGIVRNQPGIGFKLTNTGDYDMENKVLKNLKSPLDANDASTKEYVDKNSPNKNITFIKKLNAELTKVSDLFDEWDKKDSDNISGDEFRKIIFRIIYIEKLFSIILANPNIPFV